MAGRGWAWHGHAASGAFKANHDKAASQGDAVEHGELQDMVGHRDEEGGDENSGRIEPELAMCVTPA